MTNTVYVTVKLLKAHGNHKKGDLIKVDPLRAARMRKDKTASIPKDENPNLDELMKGVK